MDQFLSDVFHGLSAYPKQLQAKYLYGDQGDVLFQQIMHADQYYLTDCELEIFKTQSSHIVHLIKRFSGGFDLIELGAGDAFKSSVLIRSFLDEGLEFTYYPIDISADVIGLLEDELPAKFPGLEVKGLNGDYFEMLAHAAQTSTRPKLILFLGANIGNMPPSDAENFCARLHNHMGTGDMCLMGFDLIKNPWIIFNAYNDRRGITREFNLNLLARINHELGADFNLEHFEHFENYDPESGACRSYLISLRDQNVSINGTIFRFMENECIFVEISQKYTVQQIDSLAEKCRFKPLAKLFDSKRWFTDAVWLRG